MPMKSVLRVGVITFVLVLLISLDILLNCTLEWQVSGKQLRFSQTAHFYRHDADTDNSAVLTYKYDNLRTGAITSETLLTPANVNVRQFGRRVAYPVDGQIY